MTKKVENCIKSTNLTEVPQFFQCKNIWYYNTHRLRTGYYGGEKIYTCSKLRYYELIIVFFEQEKRTVFPRFYFIGDDDLLEILGQATNPTVIQSHLKKLFAGIHSVQFGAEETEIVAMKSLEGEVVPLKRPVPISPEVEVS